MSLWYYCHRCERKVMTITEHLICPNCGGDFLEETEEPNDEEIEQMHDEMRNPERYRYRNAPSHPSPGFNILDLLNSSDSGNPVRNVILHAINIDGGNSSNSSQDDDDDAASSSNTPSDSRSGRHPARRDTSREENLILHDIIRRVVGGSDPAVFRISVGGRDGSMGPWNIMPLHGNTDDYAWGANGLDNVISQLLGQLETAGPPPASKQTIENLPTIQITQADVDVERDCSVCMETFKLEESVKKLPCQHFFHIPCIDPWLELHNTCPICRKLVEEESSSSCTNQSSSNAVSSSDPAEGSSNPPNSESEQSFFSMFSNMVNRRRRRQDDDESQL